MPQRAQLVLRQATTGTNTENLNKAETLTFEELDRNFLGVRDQSFGIVGDDSSGVDVAAGQTITATGTGGITVAVANDTITIDGSGVADSDNQTLSFDGTNLTITGGNSVDLSSLGGLGPHLEVKDNTTIHAINTNDDLTLEANGTGEIVAEGNMDITGSLSITNSITAVDNITAAGTGKFATLTAPTSGTDLAINKNGAGNITINGLTYPASDGTADQVLKTNGSGVLSFVDQSGGDSLGNIEISGGNSQTLSGTVTNASISIDPNGTGSILLDSSNVKVGEDNTDVIITSRGRGDLKLRPEDSDATNPYILLECGVNGSTNATGEIILKTNSAYVGTPAVKLDGAGGTIINDVLRINENVFDLLDTNRDYTFNNNGTGSFVIDSALSFQENNISAIRSNDDLKLIPSGTGKIVIDGLYWPSVDGSAGQVLSTNGSGVLEWVDNAGGGGGLNNVVEDTTPQLGGDLDLNSNDITGTGNITHTGNITTTGNISSTGSIANDAVTIDDNKITTSRSNDDLYVVAAGDGYVQLGKELDADPVASFADLPYNTGMFAYASGDINASTSSSRFYGHQRILDGTVTTGGTNGFVRSRIIDEVGIDVNGNSWNQGSKGGGAGIIHFITVKNTSDGSTGAINWPQGNNSGILLAPSGTASGSTVTISNMAAYRSVSQNFEGSSDTFTVTNNYSYYATPMLDTGPGTVTIDNDYQYYSDFSTTPRINATNKYAFYCDTDSVENRIGGINFNSNSITPYTADDDLKITENGTGEIDFEVGTQTTVGSAGAATALPANPTGYLQFKVNGSTMVVPYYARS